jgi:glycosyltransferase involved in cell wall biosynthesis
MRICLATEYYSPYYGGQYSSVKWVYNQCRINKIHCEIIQSKKKNYKDKNILKKIIKKSDIIHIFGGWTPFYIKLNFLALIFKKKIIIHSMGYFEEYSLNQKKLKKFFALKIFQLKFLKKADYIHCSSLEEANSVKKLSKDIKTIILPFGVNDNFINRKVDYKLKKKALFFSRLAKKKGLDILIKSWNEINDKDWTLDIVGPGTKNNYIDLVSKNNKINFLKPIFSTNQKKKLFSKYDFFILPSNNENFGFVILESLARGVPVLTTTETPWTVIESSNAGWIINFSELELKINLFKIFNSKTNELKLKKKNTIKLVEKFKSKIVFKKYIIVYKKLFNELNKCKKSPK